MYNHYDAQVSELIKAALEQRDKPDEVEKFGSFKKWHFLKSLIQFAFCTKKKCQELMIYSNSICSRIKFTWQRIKSETVFTGGENPGLGDSGGADED